MKSDTLIGHVFEIVAAAVGFGLGYYVIRHFGVESILAILLIEVVSMAIGVTALALALVGVGWVGRRLGRI